MRGLQLQQAAPAQSAKPRHSSTPWQREPRYLLLPLLWARLLWLWLGSAGTLRMFTRCPLLTHTAASQLQTRAEARERYGIRGSALGDCFESWCCRPCALSQERQEIESEENSFLLREEK